MTLIWITLAFVAGAFFWHRVGAWLLRKVGMRHGFRSDLLRNLDVETLAALSNEARTELDRRHRITAELSSRP